MNISRRGHVRGPIPLLPRLDRKLAQIGPIRRDDDRGENHRRIIVQADHPIIGARPCHQRKKEKKK